MNRPLTDRVALITGANIGIGRAVATELARQGARLRLLCRSLAKAAPVVDELRTIAGHADVISVECDLGSYASIRTAAREVLHRDEPLHLLINNAGVAGQRGSTSDGFELTFGVNHLGHFLLTTLLLDRLRSSAPARIVHVASSNHRGARGIDWEAVRRPTASVSGLPEYNVSKLANVLFSAELARRLEGSGVTSYAINPGRVASNIWQRVPWPFRQLFKMTMLTTEQGARSTVYAATSSEVISGRYYGKRSTEEPVSAEARDASLAAELWSRSEAWTSAGTR